MAYQRARTAEQKRDRLDAILDTAEGLLDEHPYKDITMSMLADGLGYSRANLAHYVASKEEIFLLLYVRSLVELYDDLMAVDLGEAAGADARHAAELLAPAVAAHADFGRIGSLLSSIVEANVTLECLSECKATIVGLLDGGARVLVDKGLLPSKAEAVGFLLDLSNYVAGLYPATHPFPIQIEASASTGYPIEDYEESLRRHIAIQLAGRWALAGQDASQAK